jgi:multidrug transporter EmrE-like cation transporter
MNTIIIAIISVMISVAAQFMLKAGMSGMLVKEAIKNSITFRTLMVIMTDKYIIGGFVLYGIGAVVWLWVLSKWDVSKAYPLVGIGFLMTAVIGAVIGEHITLTRVAGITLICIGVWVISNS